MAAEIWKPVSAEDPSMLARFWVLIRIYCWAGLVRDEYIGFEVSYGPT